MAYVRFTITADCEENEPSRVLREIRGNIFDYANDDGEEQILGSVDALLASQSRALDEGIDFADAMECLSASTLKCCEALYDLEDWNEAVEQLYGIQLLDGNVLYIEKIELQPEYRGKGIGAQVVRETIGTFASAGVSLVACEPFPLQYSNWDELDEEYTRLRAEPGFEEKRLAAFARVEKFWIDLGFRKVPNGSGFYTFAPYLREQPPLVLPDPSHADSKRVFREVAAAGDTDKKFDEGLASIPAINLVRFAPSLKLTTFIAPDLR